MKNRDVFMKKLKLNPKYLEEPCIKLLLDKPGTLSKREKQWLTSYAAVLELRDFKPNIRKDRLSDAFIRSLKK